MKSQHSTIVLVGLIVVAALSRLIPHPFNFTPITAIAVFGGAMFANKRFSYIVPMLAMIVSDVLLGILKSDIGYAFHDTTLFVYGALALTVWFATSIKEVTFGSVAARTLVGSLLFFVVTNFGVWMVSGMYPMSVSGLVQCFAMAIPFYSTDAFAAFSLLGNQILGDIVYTGLIFGLAYVASMVTTPKVISAKN